MIGIVTALAFLPTTATRPTPNSVAACEVWLSTRHDSQSRGETHPVPNGVCFDGLIDDQSAARFVAAVGRANGAGPVTVVIRSGGGDVYAGILMGRAVRSRRATVVVRNICLSSCANYVLASASRRVALSGALVAFHGGAAAMSPDDVEQQARATHKAITNDQARRSSARFAATATRQGALLDDIGIDPDFFAWMARFNKVPESDRLRICGGTTAFPTFLVFAPELLASKGYRFADYAGPRSAAELTSALARYGLLPPIDVALRPEHRCAFRISGTIGRSIKPAIFWNDMESAMPSAPSAFTARADPFDDNDHGIILSADAATAAK